MASLRKTLLSLTYGLSVASGMGAQSSTRHPVPAPQWSDSLKLSGRTSPPRALALDVANGITKRVVGKFGRGHGEWVGPLSFAGRRSGEIGVFDAGTRRISWISTGQPSTTSARLAVFDPALRRVSYFALEDTLRFVGSSSLPFDISAACYLDGQLWVLGDAGNSAIVHRLQDSSGVLRLTQSGGTMRVGHPLDASPRFREQVVMGPIACDVKSGQVIAGTAGLGVVQLIPVRGGTASIQRIAGFQPLDYVAVDRGGLMIRRNESGKRDDLLALRTSRSGVRAIVGHQDAEQKDRGDYAWVGEFSVAKTGISAGARVRSIERDAADGLLICTADAPYPLIRVVRARNCP